MDGTQVNALVARFDRSSMRKFYAEFKTPDAQQAALKTLDKFERINKTAMESLNKALTKNQQGAARAHTPAGVDQGRDVQKLADIEKARRKFQTRTDRALEAKTNRLNRIKLGQMRTQFQAASRGRSLSDDRKR